MNWHNGGNKLSKELSKGFKFTKHKWIVISDSEDKRVLRMPLLLFIAIFLLAPVLAGIFLLVFLLGEYKALFENRSENEKREID